MLSNITIVVLNFSLHLKTFKIEKVDFHFYKNVDNKIYLFFLVCLFTST